MTARRTNFGICLLAVLSVAGAVPAEGQEPVLEEASAAQKKIGAEDRTKWTIRKKEGAIRRARGLFGFAEDTDVRAQAAIVCVAKDNTPFLSEQITGRPVWHVVFGDCKLRLKSAPPDVKDSYARTFDVFVDPRDGRLLKIVSRWPDSVPRIPSEPSAASFAEQMGRSGIERYHGFPSADPTVSFLDALDSMLQSCDNPLNVEQIVGQYVVWSRMERAPKPVWAVTLRGTRPLWHSHGPGVPAGVNATNHLRWIVDARTGQCICGGSTPQPVETGESPSEDDKSQPKTPAP